MDRLTYKIVSEALEYDWKDNVALADLINRLGHYENTGLTPEQLLETDKMYLEKCEEVNQLKEQLELSREGDLISRKELEKAIRNYADKKCCNGETELANGILKSLSVVKNQPTAYDVNKVVEQLQQDIDPNVDCDTGEPCNNWVVEMQNDLTEKHIEIVKAGGVDER